MSNKVELIFEVDPSSKGRGVLKQIDAQIDNLGKTSKSAGAQIDGSLAVFKGNLIADFFRQGAGQALAFAKSAVAAFNEANSAALGLASTAKFKGLGAGEATDAVQGLDLVKNGLLTVGDASLALKNLLASGFGLNESIELIKRFGDSAAFGRQSSLSFGQAITSATEGVKQGNSVLVDNAGVTKNLSVILKEAGFEMQDLSDKTKGAAARQALYSGLLKETAAQVGDAAKLTGTFAGQQAQLEASYQKLLISVGAQIAGNKELADGLKSLQELVVAYTSEVEKAGGATNSIIASNVSAVGNLIKSFSELAKHPAFIAVLNSLPGAISNASKELGLIINGPTNSQEGFVNLGIGATKELEKREQELKKLQAIFKQSDGRSIEAATNGAFTGLQLLDRIEQTEKLIAAEKRLAQITKELTSVEAARASGKTLGEINRDVLGAGDFGSFDTLKKKALEAEAALNQLTGTDSKKIADLLKNIEVPGAATSQSAISALRAQTTEIVKQSDAAAKLRKENEQMESALAALRGQLSSNPFIGFYEAANTRQKNFFDNFKNATVEMKNAFKQLNADVLALDLFKGKLSAAQSINGIRTELASLIGGQGGNTLATERAANASARAEILKEIETRRGEGNLTGAEQNALLAKLDAIPLGLSKATTASIEAIETQIRTAQGFLSSAANPQERQVALEAILSATSDAGRLTPDQIGVRTGALQEQLAIKSQEAEQAQARFAKIDTLIDKFAEMVSVFTGSTVHLAQQIQDGVNINIRAEDGLRIERLGSILPDNNW